MRKATKSRYEKDCAQSARAEYSLPGNQEKKTEGKMFYVYVLETENSDLYIGYTNDLKKRLREHNHGMNFSTKDKCWRYIYAEACLEKEDACRREKYFKTSQGRRLLKRRLKEHFYKKRQGKE